MIENRGGALGAVVLFGTTVSWILHDETFGAAGYLMLLPVVVADALTCGRLSTDAFVGIKKRLVDKAPVCAIRRSGLLRDGC